MVKTDHKPLTFAFRQKLSKASERQLRQLVFISQHTTDIIYVKGEKNVVADALPRINTIVMQFLTPEQSKSTNKMMNNSTNYCKKITLLYILTSSPLNMLYKFTVMLLMELYDHICQLRFAKLHSTSYMDFLIRAEK